MIIFQVFRSVKLHDAIRFLLISFGGGGVNDIKTNIEWKGEKLLSPTTERRVRCSLLVFACEQDNYKRLWTDLYEIFPFDGLCDATRKY